MTVVTFNVDQYPYCKGDTVNLDEDQLKAVDAEAERRGVKDTYSEGEPKREAEAPESVDQVAVEKEREQAEFNGEAHKAAEDRENARTEDNPIVVGAEPQQPQEVANAEAKKEREERQAEAEKPKAAKGGKK